MSELNETEEALMYASAEVGAVLDWDSSLLVPLSQAIEATGKPVDDLTVSELRQLINQVDDAPRHVDMELLLDTFNAGGTE